MEKLLKLDLVKDPKSFQNKEKKVIWLNQVIPGFAFLMFFLLLWALVKGLLGIIFFFFQGS